jgi:DNA-binding PadR family transcriptional regulator
MHHRIRLAMATLAVLNVVSAAEESGWVFRIRELAGLGPGTVYPILDRQQQANWVSACWEAGQLADRPWRRFYEMTAVDRSGLWARSLYGLIWAGSGDNLPGLEGA